jgi:hypothetical protein
MFVARPAANDSARFSTFRAALWARQSRLSRLVHFGIYPDSFLNSGNLALHSTPHPPRGLALQPLLCSLNSRPFSKKALALSEQSDTKVRFPIHVRKSGITVAKQP